ncbi:hypothetical protein C2S51_005057 [Perilla frutescens var. frutescens]|nr:hypothetical protein C2S51_005057 [Perilla frutescens var. frutescens]
MIISEEEELAYMHFSHVPIEECFFPDKEEAQMLVNAISGVEEVTTLRVTGKVDSQELHILIDTGSTLSFIQEITTRKLGCSLEQASPLLIRVANGQKLVSEAQVPGFKWDVHGYHLFIPSESYRLRDMN